ncbi:MAG: type IV secretory system conjugative DNA transfer family protein, partial [Brevundimonas aurantiaca]
SENTFASVRQSITTRMGLWLNPRVDAATAASDFDLRDLRGGRLSLYLGATPDNMLRIQPLYALLFQQLVDLNSRALPGPADRPALIVLDEFARLGPAPVLAHAFAWVAGYGLRLLAVLQSPSQLRAIYGPDVAEEVMTNCGVE